MKVLSVDVDPFTCTVGAFAVFSVWVLSVMVDPFTCTVGAFIVAQCVGFIGGRSGAFTCCVGAFSVAQCVGCV